MSELKHNTINYQFEVEDRQLIKWMCTWSDFDWWKKEKSVKRFEFIDSIRPGFPLTNCRDENEGKFILTKADLGRYTRNGNSITMSDIKAYNNKGWDNSEFDLKVCLKVGRGEALTTKEKMILNYKYSKTRTAYYLSKLNKPFK